MQGDLLEYNPLEDLDIPRVKNCFLCLDQIAGKNFSYMINVVDLSQKTSFTRKELSSMGEFQINQQM